MRLERLEISGFKSFSDRAELAFDHGVTAIVGPNGCGKSNVADAITWVLGEQSAKSLRGEKMEDVIFGGSDARKPGATAEVRLRLTGLTSKGSSETAAADVPGLKEFRAGSGAANGHENGNGRENGHASGQEATPSDAVEHDGATSPGAGVAAVAVEHADGADVAGAAADTSVEQLIEMFSRDVEVTRRLYRSGESEYLIDGESCRLRDVHELLMDTGLGAKAYAIIEQGKIGLILSSRPADRRQLIEEAAGITKYKSRRRAA
jgi:chromosome segregation protein